MRALTSLLSLTAALAAGCDNSCQTMCVHMAEFSAECGRTVSDAELQTCMDDFATPTTEERRACADFGQPDVITREWTCEDLNLYRDQGGSADAEE